MKLDLNFWLQLGGSVTALSGMYIGSTTPHGIAFYTASTVFFFWISFRQKLWGLMPLNVGSAIVLVLNILKLIK